MSSNTNQKIKKPDEDVVVPKPPPQNNDKLSTSPKSLLKQIVRVNEMILPSQPDDSPTVHLVPLQMAREGASRRSSGILATVNTPKTLIQRFLAEAPTETPAIPSNMTGNNSTLERSSVHLPAKIMDSSQNYRDLSVTASDLEEEPVLGGESITSEEIGSKLKDNHVGFQKSSSKGLKRPRRQITAKDIADGVKQSQDAEEDDEISVHKPKKAIKIRKKITAEDLAMGIKQSQEAAATAEAKPTDITEMSTSNSSLGFLTVNSENFLDTTNVAVEDSSDESNVSEDCSNHGDKQSKLDATQSEKNPPNSSEIETKKEQTQKFNYVNQLCLEESLKALRDASKKHASKENLEDKPEKPNNSMISQPRKSTSITETIPSFQLSPHTTKDLTNLSGSEYSIKHTSHVNLANFPSSSSFLKKLTVSLTDINCSGNQQFMTTSTKNFLNSTKNGKSRVDATVTENKGKEKDRFFIKENKKISDSPSSSDSEFKTSRKITYEKDIESKQDAAIISSNRNSDRENITEEKPSELKEVTVDDAVSLKLNEKSTKCEETKTERSNVETDKDIFIESLVGIPMESKNEDYTSEFIETFSLESLNEETVSSNVSQNETDEKIEVNSKNKIEASTQEKQNITDQHESKNNYDRMLEGQMELNEEPVKDFVSVDNDVVIEIEHEEMVVTVDENEVIEIQDEPIVEILDEEYIRLHNEELVGINQEAAFVYQIENKDTKNLQKENQMTLNEGIEKKHDHCTEKIIVDVQDDRMKLERETRKEKELSSNEAEIVVTRRAQKGKDSSVVNVINCEDEVRGESRVGKNNKNLLQDKVDLTTDEEEISVTKSKVEVSQAQSEENIPLFEVESLSEDEISEIPGEVEKSTKSENMSVTQGEGDASMAHCEEEDIPLFEVESLSQVEISEIPGEVDKSTKGENVSVHKYEGDASMLHGETNIGLTLDKSETKAFQNKDISKIQDESEDNMAQNEAEIDMILDERKADGIQSNKIGALQEQNKIGVTQEERETYLIQNERKAGMTQNEMVSVTRDESEGGVTQNESKASVIQDETETWVTQEESEASANQDEIEAGETQNESEADVAQEESESGATQDESEVGVSQSENMDGGFQTESEDCVSEVESKDSASEAESEVAVTQHKHLSEIQEEFETGAIQTDDKISIIQDRSKSSMILHENDVSTKQDQNEACVTQEGNEADVIKEESEVGETQEERETCETPAESEAHETQEESEAHETQEESEAHETQEESEAHETQEESEAHETQEESEAHETQEESEAHETQEESEAHETQEESEAHETQEESEAHETQEESEAHETQEESEAHETQEESEAHETQEESEARETQEESEAHETQEGNKTGTKPDKPEFSVSSAESKNESEGGIKPNKSEIMTDQKKNLTLTKDGKRTEDQYPATLIQDEDIPATTNDYDFLNEVKNDDRKEQEFNIKVKSVSKNKSISSQKEPAENEMQVDDEIIFQQNIEHSKTDYFRGKKSQTAPSGSSLRLRSSVANSSVSPKPSTSQNLSLKRKGTKRKSASNHTAEAAQLSGHSVSEKLRRRSRETNLSKTRSYRIVDSLSGIGDSMTISNQTTSQFPLDIGTVPNENQQHLQKTDQQISAESRKIPESMRPKKKLKEANQLARRKHEEYVVPPRVTCSLLSHYSKMLFPNSCTDVLGLISNDYLDNLFATLSSYANKQRRLTICQSDVELYFKNIGFTNENTSLNSLIREHLSLVDQQRLIPVARAVTTFSSTNKDSKRKSKTKDASNISTSK